MISKHVSTLKAGVIFIERVFRIYFICAVSGPNMTNIIDRASIIFLWIVPAKVWRGSNVINILRFLINEFSVAVRARLLLVSSSNARIYLTHSCSHCQALLGLATGSSLYRSFWIIFYRFKCALSWLWFICKSLKMSSRTPVKKVPIHLQVRLHRNYLLTVSICSICRVWCDEYDL